MTKEFEFLKAELDSMKENHTWQDIKQLESMQGPSVTVNHQKSFSYLLIITSDSLHILDSSTPHRRPFSSMEPAPDQ